MFDDLPQWFWVSAAWLEVLLAYAGYLLYLNWRTQRLNRQGKDSLINDRNES